MTSRPIPRPEFTLSVRTPRVIGFRATSSAWDGTGRHTTTAKRRMPRTRFPIGIYIQGSSSNTIGGTAAGEGNTISGNNVGVYIFGTDGSSQATRSLATRSAWRSTRCHPATSNRLYGVMLFNAPINNVPTLGLRNRYGPSGIANFREFSGPVAKTQNRARASFRLQGEETGLIPVMSSINPRSARQPIAAATIHGHRSARGPDPETPATSPTEM